ncbi:uncharacterized protein LOC126844987 [Adelges cooleyi]|uniref:uncharacterized protein LOC126844987 n=1 Tax=Adelges cooleyi TaxID=133065 RepID=UPI0021807D3E|nr:uncharacterized protein LOC126844987 [Adelges cooleyi]
METHKKKPTKRKSVKNNVTIKKSETRSTSKYATRYGGRNPSKIRKYTDTTGPNSTKSNASKRSKRRDEELMLCDEDDPSSCDDCDDYDDKSWKDSDESSVSSVESFDENVSSAGSSKTVIRELKPTRPTTTEHPVNNHIERKLEFPSEQAIVSYMVKNVLTGQATYNSIKNCSYTILSYNKNLEELNASQFEDMVTEKVAEIFMERSHLCQQFHEARRIKNVQKIWKDKFLTLQKRTTLLQKRLANLKIKSCFKEVSVRNVGTQLDWPYLDETINITTDIKCEPSSPT